MRKIWIALATTTIAAVMAAGATLGVLGISAAGAKPSKPVSLDGKVNVEGKKDISGKKTAKIDIEADDFYFGPTFVKASPGEKVTVELENEGDTTHTFTSETLGVDKQVSPDKKARFTFTVPSSGTAFEFHCDFHESTGMQGALYTKAGGKAT